MNSIRDIKTYKWIIFGIMLFNGSIFVMIFHFVHHIDVKYLIVYITIVWAIFFSIIEFTFREISSRENKIKATMKELFSSYQYIGNVNRQIDILINLNQYITKADFTVQEISSFVVDTCGRLAEAVFCTVFFYEKNKEKYRKSKIYYCSEKEKLNYFISHLKCDTCTNYMSGNDIILEVDKDSDVKCKYFPLSFWDKYKMICIPFVFKGQKRGYLMIILKNNIKVTHTNFKLISSLATQLGTAMN